MRPPCEKTCGLNGVRCARDCRAVRYSGSLQIIYRAYVRYRCSKWLLTFAYRNAQEGPRPGHAHRRWPRSHGNPCHALRHSKTGRSVQSAQPAARAPVLRPHATLQRQALRHKETHVDVLRGRLSNTQTDTSTDTVRSSTSLVAQLHRVDTPIAHVCASQLISTAHTERKATLRRACVCRHARGGATVHGHVRRTHTERACARAERAKS